MFLRKYVSGLSLIGIELSYEKIPPYEIQNTKVRRYEGIIRRYEGITKVTFEGTKTYMKVV